ncbi:aminoglycoside phosphotransferase family protein [Marimonas sp. MJW-29]|uniref:Aminoglycoside phosphotransferase family protein n=1 Tax=Sulfitobacter sediminis TaxID=3234186 RepID=A0ABV3RPL0_9RHOB
MSARESQIRTFLARGGWSDAARRGIAGDASNRRYERLTKDGGESAILMDAPPEMVETTRAFVKIADHLRAHGLSAPRIYLRDETEGLLLIEDLGDGLFARLMAQDATLQIPLYRAAADVLLALREVPPLDLDRCDTAWLVDMLEPLFEWYATGAQTGARSAFERLFRPLAQSATDVKPVIMLRDYHAENLLLIPGREGIASVGILDFQDAMRAPPAYDLVSILQDARRDVAPVLENEIVDHYLGRSGDDPARFRQDYALLGLQRNLRILGIFARLSRRDGKPHYVDMIPRVWGYVERNLAHPALRSLAAPLADILPAATPDYLKRLKEPCSSHPAP